MELSNALPLTSTGSTSTGTSQPRTMDLHGLIHPCPPVDSFEYSPEEEAYIKSIEEEAAALFPQGKIYRVNSVQLKIIPLLLVPMKMVSAHFLVCLT
jgi:hypothetical protein